MEDKIFQFDESLFNAFRIAIQFASDYEYPFISNEIFVASLFCEPSSPVFQAALANGFNSDEINDIVIDIIMRRNIEYSIIPSTFTLKFNEEEILLQYEIFSILEKSTEIAKSYRRERIRVEDSIVAIAEMYPEIYVDITTALLLTSKLTGMDTSSKIITSEDIKNSESVPTISEEKIAEKTKFVLPKSVSGFLRILNDDYKQDEKHCPIGGREKEVKKIETW